MHQTCRPNVSREWTELNSGKHSKWKACWQSLHWIHCHLATWLFLPSWNQAIRINSNWLPKKIFYNVWYVLSWSFVPMLKSVWNTPVLSPHDHRQQTKKRWHRCWAVGQPPKGLTMDHWLMALLHSTSSTCWGRGTAVAAGNWCVSWREVSLPSNILPDEAWKCVCSRGHHGPWCSLDKTPRPVHLHFRLGALISMGEHSQRWNVNETDQPSCNTALKAEKNWPVPIFQIKAT